MAYSFTEILNKKWLEKAADDIAKVEKAMRNFEAFPEISMWYEENMDATEEDKEAAREYYEKKKKQVEKTERVAKTFSEILNRKTLEKFNPYHDSRGRFASANGAASMTITTRDPNKQYLADRAMERAKEKHTAKLLAPTEAQEKELTRIANRTRNLKKEQLRVVDAEGNVLITKKGDRGEVQFTVGEARDNFTGNIVIHNHPDGGTFSSPDLRALGYGAKEIRVAAPEGDYLMKAAKTTKSGQPDASGWYDLQENLGTAVESFTSHRKLKTQVNKQFEPDFNEKVLVHAEKWLKAKDSGASMEEQQKHIDAYNKAKESWDAENKPKIEAETRRLYTQQYHDFYTANASKYGLEYTFTPKAVKKSMESDMEEIDDIMKADDGDIVLDGDRNRKIQQITEEIITEMGGDLAKQINAR